MTSVPIDSPVYTLGGWMGNALDEQGVTWIVEKEEGWSSSPPTRPTIEDRQNADGAWSGPGFYGPRVINLSGRAIAPDRLTMLAAKDRIKASINARAPGLLQVDEAHLSRMSMVRLTDRIDINDETAQVFNWGFTLTAPDPRRYAIESVTASTILPTGLTAGFTFPAGFPLLFGGLPSGGTTGSVFVTNDGDFDYTPATIVFSGPIASPSVAHVESGRTLTFDLTLAADETLVIDLLRQTVLLNGSANRAYTRAAGSAWFWLQPGSNQLVFAGSPSASPPPDPSMTVTAASAWT